MKTLNKFYLLIIGIIYVNSSYCSTSFSRAVANYPSPSRLQMGSAFYLLDENLVQLGYGIENKNGELYINHPHGTVCREYFPSFLPDKARKINITLDSTTEYATIYLNHHQLYEKTDGRGNANIDTYSHIKEINFLTIRHWESKKSLNFIFNIDNNKRVKCTGVKDFKCTAKNYSEEVRSIQP